jgi:hypothetical protein
MAQKKDPFTDLSIDPRISYLAETYGLLPTTLYLLALPHLVAQGGGMSGNARRFKLSICPGIPCSLDEVDQALNYIQDAGLWLRRTLEDDEVETLTLLEENGERAV